MPRKSQWSYLMKDEAEAISRKPQRPYEIKANDLKPFVRKITPEDVTVLREHFVFVFGSNLAGIHGAGAAKHAYTWFGAQWGDGEGMTGRCYAIPTKDHNLQQRSLARIGQSVELFLGYARVSRHRQYLVTKIGCGLAGYTPAEIAPLFYVAGEPTENVWLPADFIAFAPKK